MRGTLEERLWAKVDRSGGPFSCWEWLAHRNCGGYGRLMVTPGHLVVAHKIAYELLVGPVPEGLELDHQCRNRACVNPRHLKPVTRKQNLENLRIESANSSGYRGITWYPRYGRWRARVTDNGRCHLIGYFDELSDAIEAVISARNELFTNNLLDRKATNV